MTLDDCVMMAMMSNKQIRATDHLVNQYKHTQKSVYANFFPNISLNAADIYSTLHTSALMDIATPIGNFIGQQIQNTFPFVVNDALRRQISQRVTQATQPLNPEIEYKAKNMLTANITLEHPIYTGGKISTANRMGLLGVKIATHAQELAREKILVEVYEAYQLLIKAKEMEEVAHKYDSLLTQIEHEVNSAVRHGMASHNDEMKVAVKKSDAELKIRQAENGIRLARMNLCQLIGKPLDSKIDPVLQNDDDIVEMADKNASATDRTEYKLLELNSRMAYEKVHMEKSAYMPQLGLLLNAGMMDGMELLNQKLFRHKFNIAVGAVLKVPLFHANETRHKVAAAKEAYQQELLRKEELTEKLDLDLQQQANDLDEARLELQLRKRNLDQCEENLNISRSAYTVGMETLSDLLTAQVLWQEAYAQLVESRYLAKVKLMKWRKAAGRIQP
jgi:outer membrane protein TolC